MAGTRPTVLDSFRVARVAAQDGVHPDIEKDLHATKGTVSIYRSIDDFIKSHAPAPIPAKPDWVREHFAIQSAERQLVEDAAEQLRGSGSVSNLVLEKHEFLSGQIYDISTGTQFAELRYKLCFKYTLVVQPPVSYYNTGFGLGHGLGKPASVPLSSLLAAGSKLHPAAARLDCLRRDLAKVLASLGLPKPALEDENTGERTLEDVLDGDGTAGSAVRLREARLHPGK